MKISQILCAVTIASTMVTTAQADTIYGLYVDANYWHTSPSVTNDNGNTYEFNDKGQLMVSASLEHGVPMLPNARLRYSSLNIESNNSEQESSNLDAIAYYEVLDNAVSVDVGLGVKRLSDDNNDDNNDHLGLAYASAGGSLPMTGLSAKTEFAYGYGEEVNTIDAQAEIKYVFIDNLATDVGAKIGYRTLNIHHKDTKSDVKIRGPYIGAEVHF